MNRYRKVSGSTCEGGLDRGHILVNCSSSLFENKATYILLIIILICIMKYYQEI